MTELPSQEYLRSRIDYNPETGEARWKPVDESYGVFWRRFNNTTAGNKIPNSVIKLNGSKYTLSNLVYKITYNKDPIGKIIYVDNDSKNIKINNLTTVHNKILNSTTITKTFNTLPEDLHNYLQYDKRTGNLIWLTRTDNNTFNHRFAGKLAGTVSKEGYRHIRVSGRAYAAHRIAWKLYYDIDPIMYMIDHIDRNKANNIISNLRLANNSFNIQHSLNYKGYDYKRGKYVATLSINNIEKHLGSFNTEAEARAAYESALEKYKPIYQFTESEQTMLDELYANYPNVTRDLQHTCHALQVKALNHYTQAIENEI